VSLPLNIIYKNQREKTEEKEGDIDQNLVGIGNPKVGHP